MMIFGLAALCAVTHMYELYVIVSKDKDDKCLMKLCLVILACSKVFR
jgi:hypothetical protein